MVRKVEAEKTGELKRAEGGGRQRAGDLGLWHADIQRSGLELQGKVPGRSTSLPPRNLNFCSIPHPQPLLSYMAYFYLFFTSQMPQAIKIIGCILFNDVHFFLELLTFLLCLASMQFRAQGLLCFTASPSLLPSPFLLILDSSYNPPLPVQTTHQPGSPSCTHTYYRIYLPNSARSPQLQGRSPP